jgi:hypothetical protein
VERDFETVVINARQLWEEAKLQKGYEFETGKIQILRYYIEARIRSEESLNSGESLEGWIEMLYNIGGRDFESCWSEIFYWVSTNRMQPQALIDDAYEYLLDNFSLHDKEKAEQMERLNEVRTIYGMRTNNWWNDEVARWMNVHRMKLKRGVQIVQRQIPGLIDLQLEQEQPSPIESEYEDVDKTPWKEKVKEVSGKELKQIASGIEVDLIRSNMQELIKRMDEMETGRKSE